ncbi:MAG: TfoX/Sxy family protein [Proteobacteria bacterium]|nr:TfoX/Sxy family protein [Pseudomonadota bacterium]
MANSEEFVNHVLDLMAPLGDVQARPMFGGHGFFLGDMMFAKMGRDVLDLRVDDGNRAQFEDAGMERAGKMPYYRAPPEALEDGDVFLEWAKGAVAASQRAAPSKRKGAKHERANAKKTAKKPVKKK